MNITLHDSQLRIDYQAVPWPIPPGSVPSGFRQAEWLLQESVGLKGLSSLSCTMQCARGQVLE